MTPPPPIIQDPRLQGRTLCAFWDPEAQLWGTGGCDGGTATPPAPPGTVCTCSHLTSFVVLLAFYEPEVRGGGGPYGPPRTP